MEFVESVINDMNKENIEDADDFYVRQPEPEFVVPKKAIFYSLLLIFVWLVVDDFGRKLAPRYVMLVCTFYGFVKLVELLIFVYSTYFASDPRRSILDDLFANSDVEDF